VQEIKLDSKLDNTKGYILVIVMLFLLILSLLALSILNVGLLESKMGVSHQDKINSFYLAENYLLQAERQVVAGLPVTTAKVESIAADICGTDFYRLTATANYHGAESVLLSTVAKVGDISSCEEKPNITPGRQSFLLMGGI
jgi:Tfp pilus assembly protein PilX